MSNMYDGVKTWNPFKGCLFDCSYCRPSFQAQAKRQLHNCKRCYSYEPHVHHDRMKRVPTSEIVFACGNGDISFCPPEIVNLMLVEVWKRPEQTFYFQSKEPNSLRFFDWPKNVILVTTLETDKDDGYRRLVSATAPLPSERYRQFFDLGYPRKVLTIEPIMEFTNGFRYMIQALQPEYVWVGYNSRPKQIQLPEPPLSKTLCLIEQLRGFGIAVIEKDMCSNRPTTP